MARVIYGRAALEDVERVIDHVLDHAPATAPAIVDVISSAISALEQHPLLGRRIEGELRELVISYATTGYVALYEFDEPSDTVLVLRLKHQREAGYQDG